MTLTDINDLKEELLSCENSEEISLKIEECGEDCDGNAALSVWDSIRKAGDKGFVIKNGRAEFYGKMIRCPKCKNDSPDKILGSASELLSSISDSHFGCCECGEQFMKDMID